MKVAVRYLDQEDQWLVVGCDEHKREFGRFETKWAAMEHARNCQDDPNCGVKRVSYFNRNGDMTFETITDE